MCLLNNTICVHNSFAQSIRFTSLMLNGLTVLDMPIFNIDQLYKFGKRHFLMNVVVECFRACQYNIEKFS